MALGDTFKCSNTPNAEPDCVFYNELGSTSFTCSSTDSTCIDEIYQVGLFLKQITVVKE